MYPRLRNYVRQAWKAIQMERDQWEFNNAEVFTQVWPRFKFRNGGGTNLPVAGTEFVGVDSGMRIRTRQLLLNEGNWTVSPASGQIEFEYVSGNTRIVLGEMFVEDGGNSTFEYLERGSYDFGLVEPELNELRWDTMVGNHVGNVPQPVCYIPWENWFYQSYSYTVGTRTSPSWASQDFEGNVVFYPQTLEPFNFHFVYTAVPQELSDWDDEPARIPPQYHEWIAWEALLLLATYDKNPLLAAHAQRNAMPYRRRAEKNLMPIPSWRGSAFNE